MRKESLFAAGFLALLVSACAMSPEDQVASARSSFDRAVHNAYTKYGIPIPSEINTRDCSMSQDRIDGPVIQDTCRDEAPGVDSHFEVKTKEGLRLACSISYTGKESGNYLVSQSASLGDVSIRFMAASNRTVLTVDGQETSLNGNLVKEAIPNSLRLTWDVFSTQHCSHG